MEKKSNPVLVTGEETSSWSAAINWVVPDDMFVREPVVLVENVEFAVL